MSSNRQSDVASNLDTGKFEAGAANSGKILPLSQAKSFLDGNLNLPSGNFVSPTKPQNIAYKYGLEEPRLETSQAENQGSNLIRAVIRLNEYVQNEQRDLEFTVSEQSGKPVVKIISRESGDLIRFIPIGEAVDLARKLNDQEPIRLFSAQV